MALYNLQRYEDAQKAYERAIELDPFDASAYNGLGVVLFFGLSQYKRAHEAYKKAIERDPTNEVFQRNKREVLAYLKKVK